MSIITPELLASLSLVSLPVVGAFIGYFTNMVAIRMLFRPLRPWRILGCKLPFTPGVIPAKRAELAVNIGDMVGDHLLTSKEIGRALANPAFQHHLFGLIENRGNELFQKDLGPLPSLIPKEYHTHLSIAVNVVGHQIQEGIHTFVASPAFAAMMETATQPQLEQVLTRPVSSFVSGENRRRAYALLEKHLHRLVTSPALAGKIESFIQQKVADAIRQEKTVADILPQSLQESLLARLQSQVPALLDQVAALVEQPEIREKIGKGVRGIVEHFILSLGPMATMIKSFVSMETVEKKVGDYLLEKEADIRAWLHTEEMQGRVLAFLQERGQAFLQTPLRAVFQGEQNEKQFCFHLSQQLLQMLEEPEVTAALAGMIQEDLEARIEGGGLSLGEFLWDILGEEETARAKNWMKQEGVALLRSDGARRAMNLMTQALLQKLLDRPIGRIANLLPTVMRNGLYRSAQEMASAMLSAEVPGLVASLNLKQIVREKVDSLDLLRLERLLLSIMEEQFKYINLFGAILGFIIGALNVLVITAGR